MSDAPTTAPDTGGATAADDGLVHLEAPRIGRLEPSALRGVLVREFINYLSFWRSSAFSSIVEPTIYLLVFGLGVGTLVNRVGGLPYVEFVGTGSVATAVLFSSAFPAMFSTFVKYKFQRTYDAILAAPVDSEELVTAEALWISVRGGVYGTIPMLVAMVFGLDPSWGMLLVPAICFVAAFGWACFGITVAATLNSIDNFSYVMSGVLTPLMLMAGTYFPLDRLPDWAQLVAQLNPLYHCVQLVRHAAFGWQPLADLGHLALLLVIGVGLWRLAIRQMERRLVD